MTIPAEHIPFWILLWRGMGQPVPEDTGEKMQLTAEQWENVFSESLRQGVCGIVYGAVEDAPEEIMLKWKGAVEIIGRDNRKVEHIAELQRKAWERHGIGATLLKGPVSARMYPHPERRMAGDIDWWIPAEDDWKKALKVVESNNLEWTPDSDGDISYVLGNVVVEHHRKGLEAEGPEGELLLRCEHVLHHAMVAGVGFKQVCDYFAALKYYEGQFSQEEYGRLLKAHGLQKWEKTLRTMDPELVSLIFSDGNMGHGKKNRFGGFFRRARLFIRVCPRKFFGRWLSLALGRLKRNL